MHRNVSVYIEVHGNGADVRVCAVPGYRRKTRSYVYAVAILFAKLSKSSERESIKLMGG
jgi:hypothetical protein